MLIYSNPAKSRVLPHLTLSPCFLRLEFPDELDDCTVTVLVGVLGSEIGDLVLCSHKDDVILPSSTNSCTKKYLIAMCFAPGLYVMLPVS